MAKCLNNYNKKRPLYLLLRGVLKMFSRKLVVVDENDGNIEQSCIFISNHSAANGPLKLDLAFPYPFIPWGINNMCQKYSVRRRYLIDVFYGQKLKYSKFRSWLIGTLFALISGYIYRNKNVIPTFQDGNLMTTMQMSIDVLNEGKNVLIFPEDSTNGYFEVLNKYYSGFATLAKIYHSKTGKDLPVYPLYYSKKKSKVVIGKPIFVNKLLAEGKSLNNIAEIARVTTNQLNEKYIASN